MMSFTYIFFFFFFNDTATTEIYTLSLHDALPIFNWVKGIDPKTGELIERNPPRLGKPHFICPWIAGGRRSEEHTSELQSLAYLVCRLLLEKKKKHTEQLRHVDGNVSVSSRETR